MSPDIAPMLLHMSHVRTSVPVSELPLLVGFALDLRGAPFNSVSVSETQQLMPTQKA